MRSVALRTVVPAFVPAALCALLLAGCGGEEKTDKPATQVAAKVNKDEISVHQINRLLQRANGLSPEQAKQAGAQILERLIDQELLVQKAVENKLDRDPKVVQAIDAARREILAQSYREQLAASVGKPEAADVAAYYNAHPELFAERRIYAFRELAAEIGADKLPALQQQLGTARSLQDVGEWLKAQDIPFAVNASTKPAEQLPLELLGRFHQMKDGQIAVIPSGGKLVLLQLAASRTAPLDQQQSTPLIEQFLMRQKQQELVKTELKQLRDKSSIEYVGEFTKPAEPVAAKPAEAPAAAAPESAAEVSAAAPAGDDFMSKGISGLK